jgi:nicotinate-nucleotide pyrophosphorylase (carboxylating)
MTLGDVIAKALSEAMPRGDLTARHLKLIETDGATKLTAREDLVFAGREAVELTVRAFAPDAEFGWSFNAGDLILAGQSAGWVKAPPAALLTAEPLALQLLGHASGIATLTRCFVHEMRDTRARVLCGRQTTPGLRDLEFDAVHVAGAVTPTGDFSNTLCLTSGHAFAAGSLKIALARTRASYPGPIAAECVSLEDVDDAVEAKVARIILDRNVDVPAARARVPAVIPLEVGGVLTLARARELALAQVDFVRVDQLLSSAPSAEFTLNLPPAPRDLGRT